MRRRARWLLAGATAGALVLAACGGGGDSDDGGSAAGGPGGGATEVEVDPAECGLDELATATKPVEITFWHAMVEENQALLQQLTDEFNGSQGDVRVELVQFPSYNDLWEKYQSSLTTGELPDLAQQEETRVQAMLDNRSAISLQACVDADDFDLSDYLPRGIEYYSTAGTLHALPWTISNPILMYDASDFEKAGLDPADPPATLAEVREYSQRIVDSGAARHGIALRIEPYIMEFLWAKSGVEYVNNGNGRDARATEAVFDTPESAEIWTWWNDMVDDGLALNAGAADGSIDHLLAIGNGEAAMVMEASGVLGPIRAVLESGQFPGVRIGAGPLPALEEGGGVPVGDGALWILRDEDPAVRAAAWQYVKFLTDTPAAAALAVNGYVPLRTSASETPEVQAKWAEEPALKVAYTQLTEGPDTPAAIGSVIGPYREVRNTIRDGLVEMLTNGVPPADALAGAERAATAVIEDYNRRAGG